MSNVQFDLNKPLPKWDLKSPVKDVTGKEMGNPTDTTGYSDLATNTGNEMVDTISGGAALGGKLGSMTALGGPWGMAIGSVASGVMGGLKKRAERKAANRKATADMYQTKIENEQRAQMGRQAALSGFANRISGRLR